MENELQHTSVMPRNLTFHFLECITNKFSKDNIIGYGGYGVVYKGVFDNGEEIAVKKLHNQHPGLDDDKQFKNECTNLMRLQHENIVCLVGYCYEITHKVVEYNGQYIYAGVEERVLCFEYLQGGSLDKHLSDASCGLDWYTRYKIIKGICEGLNYLHNGSKDPIYHLDLKPANILLDKNMVPKIGDFGLSRLFDSTQTCTTRGIIGTPGYMPPEFINRYQITSKFDVFSLGVIIIKVMTGPEGYSKCGNMPSEEFIDLVYENWGERFEGTLSSLTSHQIKTCIEIALRCVEVDREKRPTIREIVDELNKIGTEERSFIDQPDLDASDATTDAAASDHSSHTPCKRAIIVANQLPIRATRRAGAASGWDFEWDGDSLLLQIKDSLLVHHGRADMEFIYVGGLRDDIPPADHDEVAHALLENFQCVPTFLPDVLRSRFYHGFCKQQLWPLFHYMLPLSPELGGRFDILLWQAYVSANKIFANKIVEVINPDEDCVWVHDYHLMVVPTFLRKRFQRVKLGFFLHNRFPSSEIYKTLPVREELLRSLLNADLIGFHTFDYARRFLSCCSSMLGLKYESQKGYIALEYYGRTVTIKILPVGVHLEQLHSVLNLPETGVKVAELVKQFYHRNWLMLLGGDDMDIFKVMSLKLLAFEQLLIQHPKWRGRVVLVQIANPAREGGMDVEVQEESYAMVRRINKAFGQPDYQPVILIDVPLKFYERMAYYVVAECCLVTAVRDGMNIPYEYTIARQGNEKIDRILGLSLSARKRSMLVVSEFIGCSPALSGVIRMNPWDINSVADAMHSALEMPEGEKVMRHEKHHRYVSTHDVGYWANSFWQDLEMTCRDHNRRRCWGMGFGLNFRVVTLAANFRKLANEHLVSAYRRTTTRVILLDYDGTLMSQTSFGSPSSETIDMLNSLCCDKNNMVVLVSQKSQMTLNEWFAPCENLGLAAEHGYFLRLGRDAEWETCVPVINCSWKQIAEPVMKTYTKTTDGSTIDDKETAIVWSYEDADPDLGSFQAKNLIDHLESVLANKPVSVRASVNQVEVKPQGVSKGLVAKRILSTMQDRGYLPDFILCIGDDQLDEDMFEVITAAAQGPNSLHPEAEVFTCTMRPKPNKAKYYLDERTDIMRLIQGLINVSDDQARVAASEE